MKRSQMVAAGNQAAVDPGWDRIIEQIKGLSVEQRLKLAENIKSTAIADVKAQQVKLQGELTHLSSMLGSPQGGPIEQRNSGSGRERLPENASTADKVLAALRRGGNKTVKQIQTEAGTPWVNTALSNLLQTRQIVTDGKRPAAYSLAR